MQHSWEGARPQHPQRLADVVAEAAGYHALMRQQIRFCTAADGVRIAFATHGKGPPIVRASTWLTHLEFDWQSPVWRHWLEGLGERHTVVRYDERGCGLSDWAVEGFSLQTWVADLEAVVDAAGLERFALLGISHSGPVVIAYAARHPERVSHLVLYGTYARGRSTRSAQAREEAELLVSLVRLGWGQANAAFRHAFTTLFMPGATPEQMDWFDELQRVSTSPETAARIRRTRGEVDVTALAGDVAVPALVLHARDDAVVPFEEGRLLATLLPDARFVPLVGANHILLADEPAWPMFLAEVHAFLGRPEPSVARELPELSPRELEVLGLAAAGLDNEGIAARLYLSVRTVERHLSNIYAKLGVSGKAARAAAAVRFSRLGEPPSASDR
jgi:pimeloyl-ACP methyl ester carboxylesterase/DNA-binding CsgD family transcriptional regulator